jgi:molecular chaperone HtpG
MQTQGTIHVQTENIFPIIKKFLYSDHEIFLRELVSNAVDACQKVKTLSVAGEISSDGANRKVEVLLDEQAKTITIRDNGIGMTAEEVEKYINQIAFSGAEEFMEKYKDAQIIGHFGLGFYSAFMVASNVEILTLSQRKGASAVRWTCDGSPNFTMEPAEKTEAGTDIILHIAEDSAEFLEKSRLEGILTKYCKFMPVEIQFGMRSEWIDDPMGAKDENDRIKRVEVQKENVINNTQPLWLKKPADLEDDAYGDFYHELYPTSFDAPLFHIHINVDYPFNLTGILFFPKMKAGVEVQKNKVQLYSNQVFITDEVKNILPEFLTLLHGVIDSPDIPLNVSRSYLQEDANVKKISAHITKKVADKLASMYNSDRADFETKWDEISIFIQYGSLTDEKFAEKATQFALFKSTDNIYRNLEELKEKIKGLQTDKNGKLVILYANNADDHHAAIADAKACGYEVVLIESPLAAHYIQHIEMKNSDIQFKRVDADITDKLIEKEEIQSSALSDEQKEKLKPAISELIDSKTYQLSFENMSPTAAPFVITQSEWMRRMKEQSAMGGGGFYGTLPDSYQLVANSNHPLFSQTVEGKDGEVVLNKEKMKQAIDLAKLSKGLLKGEDLTNFVKRSVELLG